MEVDSYRGTEVLAWWTPPELTLRTVAIPSGLSRSQFCWILSQRWIILCTSKASTKGRWSYPSNKISLYAPSVGWHHFQEWLSPFGIYTWLELLPLAIPVFSTFWFMMMWVCLFACLFVYLFGWFCLLIFYITSSVIVDICHPVITYVWVQYRTTTLHL